MKAFAARSVVVLAIVSGFAINAEAKTVTPEVASVSISIASTTASVGVLAN